MNRDALEDQYTALHAEALDLLDRIRARVADLPPPDDPRLTWGHCGDLAGMVEQLRTLSGEEDG